MGSKIPAKSRLCSRCILPETFPGISFDEDGVCNHCRREERALEKRSRSKSEYRHRLEELIKEVKGAGPSYDAVMAYSGGKDSSYTLKLLRERYDLRMLAVTFDNHFVSPAAWRNVEKVTDLLWVDHIRFRPPWPLMKALFTRTAKDDLFPEPTLLRASAICTACIGLVKTIVLKTALERSIPMIVFGWSPGQAPIQSALLKTNPALMRKNQRVFKKALPEDLVEGMEAYLIPDSYFEDYQARFPHNVHPLAFFDYDELNINEALDTMGWEAPTDTDANSTNCLLNALANQCHLERHGFHPYVWEIANMVRQGVMSREGGVEKIYAPQAPDLVKYAKEKLGL